MACKLMFAGKEVSEAEIEKYLSIQKVYLKSKTPRTGEDKRIWEEYVRMNSILSSQNANDEQKYVAHKIMESHSLVDASDERFYKSGGKKFIRTTQYINTMEGYGFDGDDADYEINRKWGNVINLIFDNVFEDKGLDGVDFSLISEEEARNIYDYFKSLNFGEDSIILTQVKLAQETTNADGSKIKDADGNEYDGIAGTADIVVIDKYGNVQVLDLKSSINKTSENYTTIKNGVKFINGYNIRVNKKASTKQKHGAQMTVYYNIIKSLGVSMEKRYPIGIIPIHIKDTSGEKMIGLEPEPIIKDHQLNNKLSFLDTYGKDEEIMTLIEKVKKNLGKRKDKAVSEDRDISFINGLIQSIRSVNDIQVIERFVNDAYTTLMGSTEYNWLGYQKILDNIIESYKSNPNKVQMLNRIQSIKEHIDMLKNDNLIRDLKVFISRHNELFGEAEDGSILDKMQKLSDTIDSMDKLFEDTIPDAIAEILASSIPTDNNEKRIQRLKEKEASLEKLKLKKPTAEFKKNLLVRSIKKLENEIERIRMELGIEEGGYEVDFKKSIKRQITKGGYRDINFIDTYLTPSESIDNNFLSSFALLIKNALTKLRFDLIKVSREVENVFIEYTKNKSLLTTPPEILYKDFITTSTFNGKSVLTLRGMIDYERYKKDKEAALERGEDMEKWVITNTEERPVDDIMLNDQVIVEGKKTIMKRKKRQLSAKDYKTWIEGEPFELLMPRLDIYKDSNFDQLKDNKLYNILLKIFFEAQSYQPKRKNDAERFILPFYPKKGLDRIRERSKGKGGVTGYIKYMIKDALVLTEEDQNEANYSYSEVKQIPQLYYNENNPMEADDVSKDLLFTILRYYQAAKRRNIMSENKVLGDNLLSYVKNTTPAVETSEGFKMLSKAAKYVGLEKSYSDYVAKHGNNIASLLEMFIDVTIYGRTRVDETTTISIFGKKMDVGKIADTIMGLAAKTQIGFNIITPVANSLQARATNIMEGAAKSLYSNKALLKSNALYLQYAPDMIKDMINGRPESLIGLIVEKYEPIQGSFFDNFGNKLTRSNLKKLSSSSPGFVLQHLSEHEVQIRAMIAQMIDTKLKTKDGEEISMIDAFEVVDGELKFKDNVIAPSEEQEIGFINKMHANNKRLYGIYNSFSSPMIARNAYGRMLLFYRKYLVPGWKKRWKKSGWDNELGDETMGVYRVFYNKLFSETEELINMLLGRETSLTPLERENIRRAAIEHLLIIGTSLIAILLDKLRDDEDDDKTKWHYGILLYFTMRLNAELSIYGAVGDVRHFGMPDFPSIENPFRNVTALSGFLTKGFRFYQYAFADIGHLIMGEDIERYQQDSGAFKKGYSKTQAAALKLMGIGTRSLKDIDTAINNLVFLRG